MHTRSNNFDPLRFWAALAVLWSHCFALALGDMEREPLYAISRGQTTAGTVAVGFFFAISGYLIARSFDESPSGWSFVQARVLRIMPALLVVILAQELVLGPWLTTWTQGDYWSARNPLREVALQVLFLREVDVFPGVFESNPLPHVNGSLWTLRYEVACYALVFALGVTGLLRRSWTLALYLAAVSCMAVLENLYGLPHAFGDGPQLPGPDRLLDLGATFLAGVLIYQWKVPLRARWAWLCAAVLLACLLLGNFRTAQRIALPYLVLYLALGTPMRMPSMTWFGDLSYGVYIYAWPVTQCVILGMTQPSWSWVGLFATPLTLGLAFVSWHVVEKRALAWKKRSSVPPLSIPRTAAQGPAV